MKLPDEIKAIREKTALRKIKSAELAARYPGAIVLRKDNQDNEARPWMGAIIHPSSRTAGRWQVSLFDLDGFAYDYSEPTYEQAIDQALMEGYTEIDMELLDRVGETARFMGGVIWSMLPDDKKWTTRLVDVVADLENNPPLFV